MSRLTELSPFKTIPTGISGMWPDVFDRFFTHVPAEMAAGANWMPRVDVKETPESYVFTAEAPGLKAEDINIQLAGDTLTISGEKRAEKKEEKDQCHISERTYGAFTRSFTFPVPVDTEKVDAHTKDGVLTVKVMKSKELHPRKISVKSL